MIAFACGVGFHSHPALGYVGTIGVYRDADGSIIASSFPVFSTYDIFVVADFVPVGLQVMGFTVDTSALGNVLLAETEILVDAVQEPGTPQTEFRLTFNGCSPTGTFPVVRIRLAHFILDPDLPICLQGTSDTTPFTGPWAVTCDGTAEELTPADDGTPRIPDGCLVVNWSDDSSCGFEQRWYTKLVEAETPGGSLVDIPVGLDRKPLSCLLNKAVVPPPVVSFEFTFEFDAQALHVMGARPALVPDSWSVQGHELAPGRWRFLASTSDPEDALVDPGGAAVVLVESELPEGSPGTLLLLLDVSVTDRYTGSRRSLLPNGGRITASGSVPAEALSLGALKARY